MGDIKAIILRLRDNCQRHTQGRCESIRCHMRGGGEPHEYDKATCEDREWAQTLEDLKAEIERLRALNGRLVPSLRWALSVANAHLDPLLTMSPRTKEATEALEQIDNAEAALTAARQEPSHG